MVSQTTTTHTGGGLHQEIQNTINEMETLRVFELKDLCRAIGLPISGRKNELQDRIASHVKASLAVGHIDPWRPKAVNALIEKMRNKEYPLPSFLEVWDALRLGIVNSRPSNAQTNGNTITIQPLSGVFHNQDNTSKKSVPGMGAINPYLPKNSHDLNSQAPFHVSPFFNLKKLIPSTVQKLKKASGRGIASAKFSFSSLDWNNFQANKNLRLYLFCHQLNSLGSRGKSFIQFPIPNEMLFNGTKMNDNVKGLKNKPGTAKPANLTPYMRPSNLTNTLELIYAFTKVEFQMSCYIVEDIPPEKLLEQVLKHQKISKTTTLQYIKKTLSEEEDTDFITTSTVLSLQCPISYTKMKYPSKSRSCEHLQCFDALWYLHSQLQIPTWQCPVCQNSIPLESLTICEYVDEILNETSEDVEKVELSPDGSWVPIDEEKKDHSDDDYPVKKEGTQEKLQSLPSTNFSSHSEEPIVISLDSDEEEIEQAPEEAGSIENGSSTESTTYEVEGSTIASSVSAAGQEENDNSSVNSDEPLSTIRNPNGRIEPTDDSTFAPPPPLPPSMPLSNSLLGLTNGSTQGEVDSPRQPQNSHNPSDVVPQFSTRVFSGSPNPFLTNPANLFGMTGNQQPVPQPQNPRLPPITGPLRQPSSPTGPAISSGVTGHENHASTTQTKRNQPRPTSSRRNRGDVSPFIPRRPYENILPKKRPNNNAHNDSPTDTNSLAAARELGISLEENMGSGNGDDDNGDGIIDLTSD
ncbi:hypothetical protein KAFR_0C05310 [Kazachstania africana CBS 2517]|uniref:E3 SUMO-protein transferase SIZ2 n=1 Tax=Kazachstania africana (strain ATCC 22294 / BCRC 22015 / CBS 2517 / CECT 1963 / NBRC 1671 / NRRL Y-8276) TaxID=1071382 RepID=H2AT22_KAZAF|nr:hypothetical protein KAFR_0C05310 [Kazachstania africana CBS 2517]CCF57522.1 hypothetical protein KAFR_0C05310 [Kazachstania africana CBS 2517]